jgi:DNA-binding transcriptional ArsR family regulator
MQSAMSALSDPVRLRIVEELASGERTAGELGALFNISQPGVSRHLRVLREARLIDFHAEAQKRVYALSPAPLEEIDEWITRYRALWSNKLNALETEIARGKREERKQQ